MLSGLETAISEIWISLHSCSFVYPRWLVCGGYHGIGTTESAHIAKGFDVSSSVTPSDSVSYPRLKPWASALLPLW